MEEMVASCGWDFAQYYRSPSFIDNETASKLQIIAKKITGINLKVYNNPYDVSTLRLLQKEILIGKETKNMLSVYNEIADNIDDFLSLSKEEFLNLPPFLISFFHELSHLLTCESGDGIKISLLWGSGKYDSYRKIPHEKLADNLACALIANNKQQIFDMLDGKRGKGNKKANLKLAEEYKKKYLSQ